MVFESTRVEVEAKEEKTGLVATWGGRVVGRRGDPLYPEQDQWRQREVSDQ